VIHNEKIEELRAQIEELEAEQQTPEAQRQARAQDAKICDIGVLPPIPNVGTTPWSHQLRAFWFLYHKLGLGYPGMGGGALLAMDMGTGKTKVAIDAIQNSQVGPFLVAAPLAVVPTWPREFRTHAGGQSPTGANFQVVPLSGGSVRKRTEKAQQALRSISANGQMAVFVINHESVWREPFRSFVLDRQWGGFVVDESHRAKSPGGKFSRFCAVARDRSLWRLGLTGTPMPRDQMDVYAQGRFIDPAVFGTSFTKHKTYFGIWAEIRTNKTDRRGNKITARKLVGVRNERDLHRQLDHLSYRVKADDVLDLPPAVMQTRYCALGAEERKVYKDLKTHLIAEIDGGFVTATNALTKVLRLQQVVQGYLETEDGKLRQVGSSKAGCLKDALLDLAPHEPVVVFGRFHTDLDQIHDVCRELGRRSLELSGRRNQLEEFQEGKGGEVIAVQIRSGGIGVDLSRAAYSIYFCPTYDGGAYQQSLRRTRRPTKHLHGSFIYIKLVAEGTIDVDVFRALDRKENLSEAVLAGIQGRT
jgi:SNF2 family DNA or RNA helicase